MLGIIACVAVAGSLVAVADVATSYESEMRSLTRKEWLLIALLPVVGPMLWISAGRPRFVKTSPPPPPPYWLQTSATDDNPDYIAYLSRVVAGRLRPQTQD